MKIHLNNYWGKSLLLLALFTITLSCTSEQSKEAKKTEYTIYND